MKQQSKSQERQIINLRKDFGEATRCRLLGCGEFVELLDRHERVFVYGVAVIVIRDNQA